MNTNEGTTGSAIASDAEGAFVATGRRAETFSQATIDILIGMSLWHESSTIGYLEKDWALIVKGVVRGAMDLGASLESVGRGLVLGAVRGALCEGNSRLDAIRGVARYAIEETISMGGDLEGLASGLALGAVEASQELGVSEAAAMRMASQGAQAGAQQVGPPLEELVERAHRRTSAAIVL